MRHFCSSLKVDRNFCNSSLWSCIMVNFILLLIFLALLLVANCCCWLLCLLLNPLIIWLKTRISSVVALKILKFPGPQTLEGGTSIFFQSQNTLPLLLSLARILFLLHHLIVWVIFCYLVSSSWSVLVYVWFFNETSVINATPSPIGPFFLEHFLLECFGPNTRI